MKISETAALYINLVLGFLTALANGSAFVITVFGKQSQLAGDVPEMILWVAAGLFLTGSAIYALADRSRSLAVLRAQTIVVLLLVGGLVVFGLSVLARGVAGNAPVSWQFGFLSVAALYGMVLASTFFGKLQFTGNRRVLFWIVIGVCVLIDLGAFVRVGGML